MLVQKNMIKRATLVRNLRMTVKKDYNDILVKIKINSWKDGSLDVEIQSEDFVWETELISAEKKEVDTKVLFVIEKIISNKAIICKNKLGMHLKDAITFAKKLAGDATHDYSKNESQAFLTLSKFGLLLTSMPFSFNDFVISVTPAS